MKFLHEVIIIFFTYRRTILNTVNKSYLINFPVSLCIRTEIDSPLYLTNYGFIIIIFYITTSFSANKILVTVLTISLNNMFLPTCYYQHKKKDVVFFKFFLKIGLNLKEWILIWGCWHFLAFNPFVRIVSHVD
jgi:hypothetical protein